MLSIVTSIISTSNLAFDLQKTNLTYETAHAVFLRPNHVNCSIAIEVCKVKKGIIKAYLHDIKYFDAKNKNKTLDKI
jgi:hypothetical protein